MANLFRDYEVEKHKREQKSAKLIVREELAGENQMSKLLKMLGV